MKLSNVSSTYGAPMGRVEKPNHYSEPISSFAKLGPVSLRRIPLNSGGYDDGGAYWGTGQPLYHAISDCGKFEKFTRASSRDRAKARLANDYPGLTFKR